MYPAINEYMLYPRVSDCEIIIRSGYNIDKYLKGFVFQGYIVRDGESTSIFSGNSLEVVLSKLEFECKFIMANIKEK